MRALRIAIIGFGKIAADSHVPALADNPRFTLAATVSRKGNGVDGVPSYTSHQEMLAAMTDLDAVAITTPPNVRYQIARDCIEAGLHVLLEKPPAVTLSEIEDMACLADGRQVSLFAAWHAQHNPAVAAAAKALAGKTVESMEIIWREDVRKWHPGQQWIWEAGGFGVFDPGINALSIAVRIFPGPLFVRDARLLFPENRQTPIAATIAFHSPVATGDATAAFDWRHEGGEAWTITVRAADGTEVRLLDGGARLEINGAAYEETGSGEYPDIYREFVDLIDTRRSSIDVRPLRLTADAFLIGTRATVEPFID